MTTNDQLRQQCEAIVRDIENNITVTEVNIDYYPSLELGDSVSADDYLNSAFDITYTVDSQLRYKYASIAVALSGPTIRIETNPYNNHVYVNGYWGSDKVTICANDTIGVDGYLEEMYNITEKSID